MNVLADTDRVAAWPGEMLLPGVALHRCHLDAEVGEQAGFLTNDELARADRFHFERDRKRFIRGRMFMRTVLAKELAIAPGAIDLVTERNGKPVLRTAGRAGPWFNLSHSGPFAVLAVSRNGPIGIDIEQLDRNVDALALGAHCFCPEENDVLRSLADESRHHRFFAFWTAKEARMKLTGEGMSLPPKSIRLRLTDGWPTGYLSPQAPVTQLSFVEAPFSGTICCIAMNPTKRSGSCQTVCVPLSQ